MLNKKDFILSEDMIRYSTNTFILFSEQLGGFIKDSNSNNLIRFLHESDSITLIKEFPYETLLTIMLILNEELGRKRNGIYNCCAIALDFLAINCEPAELLLYLVEQMHDLKSCCFHFLLKPLKLCLLRCRNPKLVIDVCTGNLKKFISSLPPPNEDSCLKLNTGILEQTILAFINISSFMDYLIQDLQLFFTDTMDIHCSTKYLPINLILPMLGKPLCFINLDYTNQQLIFEKVLKIILSIQCDIYFFFRFIGYENFYNWNISCRKNRNIGSSKNYIIKSLQIDHLSVCNFCWLTIHQACNIRLVQVYNPYYICYNYINVSLCLIAYKERKNILIIKALDLVHYALQVIENHLIPFEALDMFIHNKLINNLSKFIMHSNSLKIKKYALNNFVKYIHRFSNKAKYIVITKIIELNYHSWITSIVIGILKNTAIDSLITNNKSDINPNEILLSHRYLQLIISKLCTLKHGINTNLIEISDELITLLNLILFLVIRDKKHSTNTHIFKKSNYNFLTTVKTAVKLQKTIWKLKISKIDQKRIKLHNKRTNSFSKEFLLSSTEQEFQFCKQAFNTLLIIENIVYRIQEFID